MTEYEIQWEPGDNRRVHTVTADGYVAQITPIPHLDVYRTNGEEDETVFELVGHHFTISRVEE